MQCKEKKDNGRVPLVTNNHSVLENSEKTSFPFLYILTKHYRTFQGNRARLDNPMPNNDNELVEVAFCARTVPSSQCQES